MKHCKHAARGAHTRGARALRGAHAPREAGAARGARRVLLTAGCAAVATFGLMSGAHALWSIDDTVVVPAVLTGGVQFAASTQDAPADRSYSSDGSPVSVTLPGAEIIKVLDQTGPNPDPVIWTFAAHGWGDGITGVVYDVAMTRQVAQDGSVVDLASGVADRNTILGFSTTKVYPASVGGDCSDVPGAPEPAQGEPAQNVYVFDRAAEGGYVLGVTDHVLQPAGARADGGETQTWCVAMDFNNAPDGEYVNDVQVSGIADDGSLSGALDTWRSAVAFPPSLPALGEYHNKAFAWGQAEDLTFARDEDDWAAMLYPDPAQEPSVTIALDPAVINQNSAVTQPSDSFELVGD